MLSERSPRRGGTHGGRGHTGDGQGPRRRGGVGWGRGSGGRTRVRVRGVRGRPGGGADTAPGVTIGFGRKRREAPREPGTWGRRSGSPSDNCVRAEFG